MTSSHRSARNRHNRLTPSPASHTATAEPVSLTITMVPDDTRRLARLCGEYNANIKHIEQRLGTVIANRGATFSISGTAKLAAQTQALLQQLYQMTGESNDLITPTNIELALQECSSTENLDDTDITSECLSPDNSNDTESHSTGNHKTDNKSNGGSTESASIRTKHGPVRPRGKHQQLYVSAIRQHDINFGIGPAGTGKTYLAVACAVEALLSDKVERLLLVRPAVEAGEKLGFLPGDLAQKIDPYLRPLYDALYEMLGFETVGRLLEKQVIEVAPLAYMRGRTLNNAFIILDESQNTTSAQMKMFLTRIGFGSTAVITGDTTQIDLPKGVHSGLLHARDILQGVAGISFTHFNSGDVVRHPLVQRIVDAYDDAETRETEARTEYKNQQSRNGKPD